jgi:hypothetical protein
MTREEKLALLREWEQLHADLDAQWDVLARLTGASTDSALGDATWLLWDAYTNQVGERLDDSYEWLSWYQLENDMGAKGLAVTSIGGKTIKVKTVAHLARVICY